MFLVPFMFLVPKGTYKNIKGNKNIKVYVFISFCFYFLLYFGSFRVFGSPKREKKKE